MRPQIGVPPAARSLFAASAPALIATWALAGLYLSLGPSLALSLLKSDSYLAGAGVIVALMGAVAVAATLVRAADARVIVIRASLVLVVGVGITELSVALGSAVGLYAGSVLAGLGFGPAFSAVFRSLAPLAPPDKRAELLASIFIVVYLAFSVPALIAGVAVTHYGLRDTTYVYGIVVMTLAAMTAVQIHLGRSGSGATMKLAYNAMIALTNEAIAEALVLTERAGIAPADAYSVLSSGALASPFVDYKRAAFLDPDRQTVAFTTALMQKDLTLALELAQALDVPLPATAAANEVLSLARRLGYGDDDIARVADTLRGSPAHE